MGAPRAHLQLDARAGVGDMGRVPTPRGARSDDVRPDDGRLMDLYRNPGHPPGYVRNLRCHRAKAFPRLARRDDYADRRPGGMGGAQPLAVTLNGGVAICVEADDDRIKRRIEHRYLDVRAGDLEHALRLATEAKAAKRALSIGLHGNAAEILPALAA